MHDVVIVGGGHNGLIAAALIAKAGLKPLVVERADRVGGCAQTTDLAPGFRCPMFAHRANLHPWIVNALGLSRDGWQLLRRDALVCAPTLDGRALTLWIDPARAGAEIAAFSARDAEQYPEFLKSVASVSAVLRVLATSPMPALDGLTTTDVVWLLRAVRKFRALGRRDAYRLLRWMPMSMADFVAEWFESEPLLSMIAADGVLGAWLGPRSAGGTAGFLLRGAAGDQAIAPGWMPRGGMGALGEAVASAAVRAGAAIRVNADVRQITVEQGQATGVVLASGEEIRARLVVSNADPRRTLLGLVDPIHLSPGTIRSLRNIRMRGTLAKVNYAVSSLPQFTGLTGRQSGERNAALSGCVRLCRSTEALERAFDAVKYGRISEEPWVEIAIPSIGDERLAPSGGHVISAYVQFAPFDLREGSWEGERERLGDITTRTIAAFAPGFERSIVARQVLTPFDLERAVGLTGGQIFHGEIALDQLFAARPVLGWIRHSTPIRGLFLCGNGTHPGTGLDGLAGMHAAQEVIKASRNS
jgi:phytoene dehydrogenase-like protein